MQPAGVSAAGEACHLGNWMQPAGVGAARIPADLGEWVRYR